MLSWRRTLAAWTCAWASAGSLGGAQAGTLQLSVSGADGKPAADTVVLVMPSTAWSPQPLPEPVVIAQKDIRFVPYVSVVPLGATVRFVNRDSFDHHVRSQPGGPLGSITPAKQFEFRLAGVRGNSQASADLKADVAGIVLLGCHLHNSMRGHLFITETPWYAVTDDNGRASIEGIPEGAAELRLWHPDQLVEQPVVHLQVAGSVNNDARLNFTPRKRPPPRVTRKGDYDY